MAYQYTIYDMFEMSDRPSNGLMMTYEGGDPAYPATFGPVIEPVVFSTPNQGYLEIGTTTTLDGTEWRVTGFAQGNIYKYGKDPALEGGPYGVLRFVYLTDGTETRFLAVEEDGFAQRVTDYQGNVLDTKYYQIWTFETASYLPLNFVSRDDPNHLFVNCFTTGTMIATLDGPRPVERLRVGDMVCTRDRGLQPIRWLGGRRLSGDELAASPRLAPIRIRAGALGPGQPSQDLTVSPQHRILVRSAIARRMTGTDEVLVPAIQLTGLPGVTQVPVTQLSSVGYWHLMFDAHEIVFANGAEAESLFLGPMAVEGLSPQACEEIAAIFPDLLAGTGAPMAMARPELRGKPARKLVERQVRNDKPLVAPAV